MPVNEKLAEEMKRRAVEGRLPCAVAFQIAERLRVPRLEVGQAADELGLRITDCQLGCFGQHKK